MMSEICTIYHTRIIYITVLIDIGISGRDHGYDGEVIYIEM